jgi:hypothetical protein
MDYPVSVYFQEFLSISPLLTLNVDSLLILAGLSAYKIFGCQIHRSRLCSHHLLSVILQIK